MNPQEATELATMTEEPIIVKECIRCHYCNMSHQTDTPCLSCGDRYIINVQYMPETVYTESQLAPI